MNKKKKIKLYLLSFFLPVFSIAVLYFLMDMAPFGDKSILTKDLLNQYVSYFSHLTDVFSGEADLSYSFSKTLGGEMIGLTAYYLSSPFNLIFFFANINTLPFFILIVTLLKIGMSSVTMLFYLNQKNTSNYNLLFSVAYSLMNYNLVYQQNIMWLDGVVFLPLIIMGIDRIIEENGFIFYSLSLALAIMSNYYIGFMLCIFSVLYFAVTTVSHHFFSHQKRYKYLFKITMNFIIGSIISGGLIGFLLVPLVYSLQGGKATFSLSNLVMIPNFKISDMVTQFFMGSFNEASLQTGLPNIFVSYFIIIGTIAFFCSKKVPRENKMIQILLLVFLMFSFYYKGLNMIWHGLNEPAGFPYRYSFLFSFLLVVCAAKYFQYEEQLNKKAVVITAFIFLIAVIYGWKAKISFVHEYSLIVSCLFFVIILTLLLIDRVKQIKQTKIVLLIIIIIEMIVNGYILLGHFSYSNIGNYTSYVNKTESIIQKIDTEGFYRLEKNYRFSLNDPLLLNYNGLTHFSSTEKDYVKDFMKNMGFSTYQDVWAAYSDGSTVAAESLLGVKYLLLEEHKKPYYQYNGENKGISIYENQYAFPIGFLSEFSTKSLTKYKNTFEYQNEIFHSLGIEENIFEKIPLTNIEIDLSNLNLSVENGKNIYTKINPDEESYIDFYLPTKENSIINFYFTTESVSGAEIHVNDEYYGLDFDLYNHTVNTVSGNNDTMKISLKLTSNRLEFTEALFYEQDMNLFQEVSNFFQSNPLELQDFKDTFIRGTVNVTSEARDLILTIPYDEGWKIKVDGQVVKQERIWNTFMLISLTEGYHTIEISYIPVGVKIGIVISILSGLAIMMIFVKEKKKKSSFHN